MTHQRITVCSMAILGTLEEIGPSPASYICMALGMDTDEYEMVIRLLTRVGHVKTSNHLVSLTQLGSETAKKINAIIA